MPCHVCQPISITLVPVKNRVKNGAGSAGFFYYLFRSMTNRAREAKTSQNSGIAGRRLYAGDESIHIKSDDLKDLSFFP